MLKEMLESKNLEFIMEAHNGLSAKIVQEAGKYDTVLNRPPKMRPRMHHHISRPHSHFLYEFTHCTSTVED